MIEDYVKLKVKSKKSKWSVVLLSVKGTTEEEFRDKDGDSSRSGSSARQCKVWKGLQEARPTCTSVLILTHHEQLIPGPGKSTTVPMI